MPWGLASVANVACRQTFGETATVAGETCRAIFDQQYQSIELAGEVPITTTRPVLDVVLDDLTDTPEQGDTVVVNSVTYQVADVQTDGQGGAKLFLRVA
jgi:hypothetical protein